MRSVVLVISVAAAGAALSGCGGPEVKFTHTLPPDLPVPAKGSVFVGQVAVASGPEDSYAKFTAERLTEQLRGSPTHALAESAGRADLAVSAQLHVETSQRQGTRVIRRFNPQRRRVEVLDAATLVRTAAVRADFVVTDAKTGQKLAAAETRQAYNSADDPRSRGPLGLDRPDGPTHLPPAETIVRELLAACVETFLHMVQPRQVAVQARLRGSGSPEGRKGLAAAGEGGFDRAVEHLSAAVQAQPENADLRFNLALCAEAAGELQTALVHYEAGVKASGGRDRQAAEAAQRVKRVLRRME
jgi:tetratricopeptide (TPR) repeat protein